LEVGIAPGKEHCQMTARTTSVCMQGVCLPALGQKCMTAGRRLLKLEPKLSLECWLLRA